MLIYCHYSIPHAVICLLSSSQKSNCFLAIFIRYLKKCVQIGLKKCDYILFYRMNSEKFNVMDMNERDLEKLSKAELINLVEKLQNKARKPKIAIVDDGNGQVPQPQKPKRRIPPRYPKT